MSATLNWERAPSVEPPRGACPKRQLGRIKGEKSAAQKTYVQLIDDLDGSEADETVTFALDGKVYVIDLAASNGLFTVDGVDGARASVPG